MVSNKCHKRDLTTANFDLDLKVAANYKSDTPRQYSQWLNPVNYWLKNHCMGWTRTGVTSFGRQFDFNDVTYHIGHCNADTRRSNVVFTIFVRSKGVSAHDGFLQTLKDSFIFYARLFL